MERNLLLLFVAGLCLTEQASTPPIYNNRFLANATLRIVGGWVAPEAAWPWQVSVQLDGRHHCGGIILSSLWVLSASHCFTKKMAHFSRKHLTVVAGLSNLSNPGKYAQTRYVSYIKMHKNYNYKSHDYDAALLRLAYPLDFTERVQPTYTPDNVTHEALLNFTSCYISGWGSRFYKGPGVVRLRQAKVELIDLRKCNLFYWSKDHITENMICAGKDTGGVDTCQGDSGGPLQCYSAKEKKFYVVGVTSSGVGCGHPCKPGVYTRTSRISDWIKETQKDVSVVSGHTSERVDIKLASGLLIVVLI